MQVATGLRQDQVTGHGEGESVEEDHELVDVHLLFDGFLPVNGHDADANEEMEGIGLVVGPARLPNGEGVFLGELPLETHQKPAMAEHETEATLSGVQIGVEPREEVFDE